MCARLSLIVVLAFPVCLPLTAQETKPPLSPAESAQQFEVAEGLQFEQVLAEPNVRQPLSMKFDERGRIWVAEYIQYPNPAGLKMVSRDSYWRAVYDGTPVAPPNHAPGADRISIHEDTNGDGQYDKHSVFLEGTSITTSFAFDADGVWVLNPPYLLFYPDVNRDDVPDGDPIVHLEGFGIEDTHSCANSLCWGPDGWLYGAQGSTVSGRITRTGMPGEPVTSMGQLIWRYHPTTREYEIFAEGGGNAFGVEFDSKGRVFSGHNGGNTRGFHYVQGGYFQKGFTKHGPLSNPYAFGYFSWMGHHDVPRFTHDFVIYEGGALPGMYDGKLIGVGPLQSHLVLSEVTADGSTLKTTDLGHPVESKDTRFRPVEITVGPDGAVYVADFYEDQISHRQHFEGLIEKDTGRIYRLQSEKAKPLPRFDLRTKTTDELLDLLTHKNRWFRQTALRLLGQRNDRSCAAALLERIRANKPSALECLWTLNQIGMLTDPLIGQLLEHPNPYVRAWTVRLACDDHTIDSGTATALTELARRESNVEVRSQLACSARRLDVGEAFAIVDALVRNHDDSADPHIPLLIWWAIESKADSHHDAIARLFESDAFRTSATAQKHLLNRIMRRFARAGRRRDLLTAARLFGLAKEPKSRQQFMAGFEKAFEGRSLSGMPDELVAALANAGGGSLVLQVRQRKPDAIAIALSTIADNQSDVKERRQLIDAFADLKLPESLPTLLSVATEKTDPGLRAGALVALQGFADPKIATRVLSMLKTMPKDVQEVAQTLLSSRAAWAVPLLQTVESGEIDRSTVSQDTVWRLQLSRDKQVQARAKELWPAAAQMGSTELRQQVRRIQDAIREDAGDPYAGKKLFTATCGKCHRLFDAGGEIGPDLTSYKRDDTSRLLMNILAPSAEIREGYETWLAITDDGRSVSGFKIDEDDTIVTLKGADGVRVSLQQDELDELIKQPVSLMPRGLLDKLSDQQKRDLFAYLRSSQPLNNRP